LSLILPFCKAIDEFLAKDAKNVVGIHCKAGKGRTGTMIVAYMVYCGYFKTIKEAAALYGEVRTKNGKGITIQSQMRSILYFEDCINRGWMFPKKNNVLLLKSIMLYTTPRFNIDNSSKPYFKLESRKIEDNELVTSLIMDSRDKYKPNHFKNTHKIMFDLSDINMEVSGDIRVQFLDYDKIHKHEKMFQFYFNTNFINKTTQTLVVLKKELDGKAQKDKKQKYFDDAFYVELKFELAKEGDEICVRDNIEQIPSRFGNVTRSKSNSDEESSSGSDSEDKDDV
jgi:phosphatidylinositol-3,4,5-trisphosphate 3-phosphatase/dual-specificity protein phosphatase PTEN